MDYERAVATAPPGWTHFQAADLDRLPPTVRKREWARVPAVDRELLEAGDGDAWGRALRAFFWTLVYHLEPNLWDELAAVEPIHPALVSALPTSVDRALDVGAGSGRLTAHLLGRCRNVVAVEPSIGLRNLLHHRLPAVNVVAGWGEGVPVGDGCSQLPAASGSVGAGPLTPRAFPLGSPPGGRIPRT